ncbi:MAG: helix-turn-helix domain-containing protein [Calditrichaeota bacterium]|nr:MAG: helix-turn-helix domain-containing protein [Calditrichota bacterium]MBL1204347.1 helix-turn-helix domain-containing protein [Calditrichota bacterium]NOG44176.1 helix-turn-helix domain-containing protein [Calditrichota bacterium]
MNPQHKVFCIGFSYLLFDLIKYGKHKYVFTFEKHCFNIQNKIRDEKPSLIILFSQNIHYLELCKKLNEQCFKNIPIIYITEETSLYSKLQILELGVDAYLLQPICIQELMIRINSLIKKQADKIGNEPPKIDLFLKEVNQQIEKNIDNPLFDTSLLALSLNLSRSQLYKKLKQKTGKSTTAYVRDYKLNKAKNLIEANYGSVSQVALEVGFNSFNYFSIQFKKQFGFTPSSLQKS